MDISLRYLLTGVVFGLAAGTAPGPLLTLVIRETVKHGKREGVMAAVAPAFTDVPIVLASTFVISRLASQDTVLAVIAFLGAGFITYLAYESITSRGAEAPASGPAGAGSLKKGILTNALSPHPYIFWITIGSPLILRAYEVNALSSVMFIVGFYVCLIGSKVVVALLTERSKSFLKSAYYIHVIRALGFVLLVFAVAFAMEGLRLLGVLG